MVISLFDLILASTSSVRSVLLTRVGLPHRVVAPRVDEDNVKRALLAENASHRDIADTLADMKARKVAERHPVSLVLGCDQVLSFGDMLFSKPRDPQMATSHLCQLQGKTHQLYTAIVLYEAAKPVWRHVARVDMTMLPLSTRFIDDYVTRNWDEIQHSVGGYLIESEGLRLFSAIKGEQTEILGLPIPPLLGYLAQRGFFPA